MNIALIDDKDTDRIRLECILRKYGSIHQLDMKYSHFASGEALLKEYQPFKYAILFLDIYMEGLSGIETAERIRQVDDDTVLVFLTTSEDHRSEAFSLFAVSYLTKPCSEERVFRTMDHILRIQTKKDLRFSFSYDRRDYSLAFKEIVSLETDGNYLIIIDRNGNSYRTRMTFSAAQMQLDNHFLTLMKGIIVNMDYISLLTENRCVMQGGGSFPIRIKNQKDLKQKWLNYKFSKIRNETAEMESYHA